jgi:transcriptional regulator with XRE-family HTH domain
MDSFKERLTTAMERVKCDRAKLAKELGVSVQAVGAVLLGDSKALSAANTAKAARFLGVDWYWLATGEGQIEPATSWPVRRVPVRRFTDLKPEDQAYVEGQIKAAIEECERNPAPSAEPDRSYRQPLTVPKKRTPRKSA